MAKTNVNYFVKMHWLLAVIIHFFFGWILSFVWRLFNGKNIIWTILSLPFLLGFVFWWVDLFSLVLNRKFEWLV